jgi:hypothetical protein
LTINYSKNDESLGIPEGSTKKHIQNVVSSIPDLECNETGEESVLIVVNKKPKKLRRS